MIHLLWLLPALGFDCRGTTIKPFANLADFDIENLLSGTELTIGVQLKAGFAEFARRPGGIGYWEGYDVDIMEELAKRGNFKIRFKVSNHKAGLGALERQQCL
jgi:hypothetical protein